jgi:hypothetical protein
MSATLEALLAAEMEERESRAIGRLLHEARLPRMKTLDAFEFDRSASTAQLRTLAEGDYVAKAEPVSPRWSARLGGKDPFGHRTVRPRVPPAPTGAVHHRDGADQ